MVNDAERLKRVSALFDEMTELSDAARTAALAALAVAEPEVAAELTRWLAQDQRSQGALDLLTQRFQAIAEPTPAESGDRSGQRIGDCTLLRRVGRGGMGEVYEARRDGSEFEQKVAVKLLRRGLDSEDMVRRFVRERRILAQLEHPGIARLIDGGMSDDGQPYLVMEFVDGQELIVAANARALDLDARLRLFAQICDAVAYAHRRLIVHRDLKPANVLLTADHQPKLLDFGIAKLLDEVDDEHLTGTGMRVLTPGYAAPEQILGQPISTATDVYALGVILYELMTGLLPHQRRGKDLQSVTRDIDRESLLAPSAAVMAADAKESTTQLQRQRLARRLNGDLDTITLHALKREPERRYQGAAELADDIRRHLDGLPVRAEVDTLGYRLGKFVKRHRGGVTSAALGLLGIIAGLVVALSQADIARKQAARADAEAGRANAEAQRAEHEAAQAKAQAGRTKKVKEFLVSVFTQADPMRRAADGPVSLNEAFDATLRRAETELAGDPVLQADVFDDFGEIRANQGRFDEALALFEKAISVAEKEYGPEHPVLAESLVNFSVVNTMRRRALDGAPQMERAVAILENDDGGEPLALANALSGLSAVRQQQGRIVESAQLARRSLAVARLHRAADDMDLAVAITNVAAHDTNEERHTEAEAGFREAMAIVEKRQGADSPHLWANLSNIALVYYSQGKFDEEVRAYERALAIARSTFPADHPWIAQSLVDVGWTRARDGKPEEGEKLIRDGVAMYERLGSPRVIIGLRRLGTVQHRRGDHDAALATLSRGWDYCKANQPNEQHCVVLRANRAHALALQGQGKEALSEAEAAVAELAPRAPGLVSERSQTLQAKAAALAAQQRGDEALAVQDEVIALLSTKFGAKHPETIGAIKARAELK